MRHWAKYIPLPIIEIKEESQKKKADIRIGKFSSKIKLWTYDEKFLNILKKPC